MLSQSRRGNWTGCSPRSTYWLSSNRGPSPPNKNTHTHTLVFPFVVLQHTTAKQGFPQVQKRKNKKNEKKEQNKKQHDSHIQRQEFQGLQEDIAELKEVKARSMVQLQCFLELRTQQRQGRLKNALQQLLPMSPLDLNSVLSSKGRSEPFCHGSSSIRCFWFCKIVGFGFLAWSRCCFPPSPDRGFLESAT